MTEPKPPFEHMRNHDALDAAEPMAAHSSGESESRVVHYPDHPDRKASALYTKTHHELCVVQDTPCFVCGFKHSQATSAAHTTETHHIGIEWAAMAAVDWKVFVKKMAILGTLFTGLSEIDPVAAALDPTSVVDSVRNMLVLCSECHRDQAKGVHHAPFPEWVLQAFAKDGFVFLESATKTVPQASPSEG